ncbi:polysaccharide pyruvyl transferase family protein [Novosphingobium guangzhouense]|uniref:Polysaccharide pyruvyl transferase domain-containing protein n=1 Tax=Novosphingobium guangzhouense TaxID=1850347 RepID=A0A2K2FZX2_9SPHN|nr:polysaccharide pyruvyl transferase family protein [Novosphingobium guangzhouense]PNU04340.1 hypothetical protein A8V01_20870 [Novosphingobium guangzhouense]
MVMVAGSTTEDPSVVGDGSRIVICGVTYAPNLGDGVIAECMAHALKVISPSSSIMHVDLAAREGYGQVSVKGKRGLLFVMRAAPSFVRRLVVDAGLSVFLARKALPKWRALFRSGDIVIIGGGHLLSDYNLNFPKKIELVTRLAHEVGARMGFHAVGVSANWSRRGTKLFAAALARCSFVATRDAKSLERLEQSLPGIDIPKSTALDPGYLAKSCYSSVEASTSGVGLNVSDPDELAQYAGNASIRDKYDALWIALVKAYADAGYKVNLFTNGAEEDESYLAHLADLASKEGVSGFSVITRSITPSDLVAVIKGLDLLVGHRLHAQIVAFAHDVPSVALGWDDKLESQMALMGRGEFVVPFGKPDADTVLEYGRKALAGQVDGSKSRALASQAQDDLLTSVRSIISSSPIAARV